jgi:hypothetical protein
MVQRVVLCLVVAASLIGVSLADARLVFRDSRPLAITVGARDRLAPVSVCNTGRRALRRVQVVVKGFGFKTKDGKALVDTQVLGPARVKAARPSKRGPLLVGRIAAGRCRTFIVRKESGANAGDAGPGTYTGVIVAIARGGGIARRTTKVIVAGDTKTPPATVTALNASATLLAHTKNPLNKSSELEDDANIALVSTTEPTPPQGCKPGGDAKQTCFVGNVSHGTDVAWVYISGKPTPVPAQPGGDHAWKVPVKIADADQVGEYKGTLDFGPGGKDSKPTVALTVDVGDKRIWPIVLVLAIQLIAMIVLLHRRRLHPHREINKQLDAFPGAYASAAETYHEHEGLGRRLIKPSEDKINAHVNGIRGAAEAYHSSTMLYSPTSDAYKAILKSIDDVQADVDSWRGGLGSAMDALAASAGALPTSDPPALARKAASLLASKHLEVGEAVAREQRARELTDTLDVLAVVIADCTHAQDTLDDVKRGSLTTQDRRRRERAEAILDGAHWRVWNATTAEELNVAATRAEIARAQGILDELKHVIDDQPLVVSTRFRAALLEMDEADRSRILLEALGQRGRPESGQPALMNLEGLMGEVAAAIGKAAQSPRVAQVAGRLVDAIVFLVTAGATLIVAITALHLGDTFGTLTDYLALFAASVTGPIIGTAALEAVGRWRLARADPLLRSEAEPAAVAA